MKYQKAKYDYIESIKVWYVEPFGLIDQPAAFVYYPGENCGVQVMIGDSLESFCDILREAAAELGCELKETWGVKGIASTDPYWDGKPTFRCGRCSIEHDVHENVAQVLYQRLGGSR